MVGMGCGFSKSDECRVQPAHHDYSHFANCWVMLFVGELHFKINEITLYPSDIS